MGEDCVFCRIVDGDAPSYDVYEDDQVLAFLDINPSAEGHTLVVPKAHREHLTDLDAEETAALFDAARRVAAAVEHAVEPDGYTLFQTSGATVGQELPHSHVHILPRYVDEDLAFDFAAGDLEADAAERVRADIRDAL